MPGKISRGWGILEQSWLALGQDKKLLLLPALSVLACLLLVVSFLLPLAFVPEPLGFLLDKHMDGRFVWQNPLAYVWLFGFYFRACVAVVFFNTALVLCAVYRFDGGQPTIRAGLRVAMFRLPQILGWALVAGTIGMVLHAIEERLSWLGQWVISLIGVTWSIVTYFVIPVMAVEGLGPFAAVRRSAKLLRRSWGSRWWARSRLAR